ncbi:MAG: hypothetical protein ACYC5A_09700 [Thermoleophilia bacterium]
MPFSDYRELSPVNRHRRVRRIENLKAAVRANRYEVGSGALAEVIIREARRQAAPPRH